MRKPSPWFKRSRFLAVALLVIALPYPLGAQLQNSEDPLMLRLIRGNQNFVANTHFRSERQRVYSQEKQTPYAIVLSCSDSRVPPEVVLGEWLSLGNLFVIRVAGNVVDPAALGSIEYGAQELKAKLIFVLGHEKCGAVEAAIKQAANPPAYVPPNMAWFVDPIKLAVERTPSRDWNETIKQNVRVQIQNLRTQSSIIRNLERTGEVRIRGGFLPLTLNGHMEVFPEQRRR